MHKCVLASVHAGGWVYMCAGVGVGVCMCVCVLQRSVYDRVMSKHHGEMVNWTPKRKRGRWQRHDECVS